MDGLHTGKGVYSTLMEYINEHHEIFDHSRNTQWKEVPIKLNKNWFTHNGYDQNSEKVYFYVQDLICSVLKHASSIALLCKRKTMMQQDVEAALKFLDDVY